MAESNDRPVIIGLMKVNGAMLQIGTAVAIGFGRIKRYCIYAELCHNLKKLNKTSWSEFMETNTETKPGALPEGEKQFWNFCLRVGVQGADDLRKVLGLDELNFRHLAPQLNQHPKQYFLYRVLDEIQKAALKINDWKEFLSENKSDALQRIDYETIIDDQQFRARKLNEVLIDSILFSTTNSENRFSDYFLFHELDECARSQEDRREFFGFTNRNAQWSADRLLEEIRKLENEGLDPKSRWYIKDKSSVKAAWAEKGVPFSSFRSRYKQILPICLPSELNTLGKTYIHAYGMSKDVHFTPHDTSSGFREEEIYEGVSRVRLLVLALVIRCQHLLGCIPEGVNKHYREMHDNNTEQAELAKSLKSKPADPGDIVWIHGNFAEVLDVKTSKYGYPAYYVRYIERAPLAEIPEDWFAGFEVKLIAKKSKVLKAAHAAGEEIQKATGQCEDSAKLLDYAKRAVIQVWHYSQQMRQQMPKTSLVAPTGSTSE